MKAKYSLIKKQEFVVLIKVTFILILLLFVAVVYNKISQRFEKSLIVTELPISKKVTKKIPELDSLAVFISYLRNEGLTVEIKDLVTLTPVKVPGIQLKVDEDSLMIFEYENEEDLREDLPSIENNSSDFVKNDNLHFFRKGETIVVYQGDKVKTLLVLEEVLGPQFIGK